MRQLMLTLAVLGVMLSQMAGAVPAYAAAYDDLNFVSGDELKARIDGGEQIVLLDVRSNGAYNASDVKIKGSLRIAPDELPDRLFELPFGREIATYCT